MSGDPLTTPVCHYGDVERLLLSRVREDPRPYAARGLIAGRAVSALLERVGHPERGVRFLHIAGSKGKGSVALLAEALLLAGGAPVGTYTSPHLRRWNERVRVQGRAVDDATLAQALETLRPHVAALDALGEELAPSFFDLVTAAGLLVFARAGCATVVLEVGLGGLHDATNVVTPAACCITSIELEHTDKLGPTLSDVAHHKAGIIKACAPVVTGALPPEALAEVEARVRLTGTCERRLGREWWLRATPSARETQQVRYGEHDSRFETSFTLAHPAPHMAINAGIALALVRAAGLAADVQALATCTLPARAQVLRRRPWVVVDGAHTSASFQALAGALDATGARERRFVVGATRGKSLDALAQLLAGATQVVVTRADALRSAPAPQVAQALAPRLPGTAVRVVDDPRAALHAALAGLPPDGLLCVCGSVYLAGAALAALAPE